ncbi:hypothetical protein VL20_4559 [Microcystis panniformis FACHB-1757]|uniref:Uncharacterized protein n=1 Tax=Microcystis panniformis FACHB-1757 TaxID=1638788 RepID=A0A0K1S5N8_9CHRO|nr:hypothetical protein VL20_4559 [Microcystis panniformis FACHB-1757]
MVKCVGFVAAMAKPPNAFAGDLRLSWVWWVKSILRYIPTGERMERTTKTQRTQRLIGLI